MVAAVVDVAVGLPPATAVLTELVQEFHPEEMLSVALVKDVAIGVDRVSVEVMVPPVCCVSTVELWATVTVTFAELVTVVVSTSVPTTDVMVVDSTTVGITITFVNVAVVAAVSVNVESAVTFSVKVLVIVWVVPVRTEVAMVGTTSDVMVPCTLGSSGTTEVVVAMLVGMSWGPGFAIARLASMMGNKVVNFILTNI